VTKAFKTAAIANAKIAATNALAAIRKIEPTDASFVIGLVFLHSGVAEAFGRGEANIVVGTILVITPLALILRSKKV